MVSVDINPSIAFEINKDDVIVKANYYNEEGQEIVESLDFRGMVLQAGIDEVLKAAKELGYINEDVNIVLVSATVYSDADDSYITQLKNLLEGLNTSDDQASIMAVYVEDSTVFDLAKQNDISIGKALLYQYALNQGLNVSLSDIKNSSVSELLTLLDLQVANLEMETQETTTEETTTAPETTTTQTATTTTNPSSNTTNPSSQTPATSNWSPGLEAYVANGSLFFGWNALPGNSVTYNGATYYNFQFYKIAYDRTDTTPTYPENSYLTYISNYANASYGYTPVPGGKLDSGALYHYSITYVFENGYIYSNTVSLTTPTYSTLHLPLSHQTLV